eukprot:scaffold107987_cov39-Phaeocystis_antarctica.AAC.1
MHRRGLQPSPSPLTAHRSPFTLTLTLTFTLTPTLTRCTSGACSPRTRTCPTTAATIVATR